MSGINNPIHQHSRSVARLSYVTERTVADMAARRKDLIEELRRLADCAKAKADLLEADPSRMPYSGDGLTPDLLRLVNEFDQLRTTLGTLKWLAKDGQ